MAAPGHHPPRARWFEEGGGTAFMKTLAIAGILLGLAHGAPAAGETAGPGKPNIVLIMCDDAGFADFGCYGGVVQTPVLDRLAKEGIRFTRAYNNGRCWPTRASLMSGLNPQLSGDSPIGPQCATIPELLREAGYGTAMVGKWHLGMPAEEKKTGGLRPTPVGRGFERFYGIYEGAAMPTKAKLVKQWEDAQKKKGGFGPMIVEGDRRLDWSEVPDDYYVTYTWGRKVVDFVKETPADKPLFLYVAHTAPHWPLEPRPASKALYEGKFDGDLEELRKGILERQKAMGLFPAEYPLAPRHPETAPKPEARARATSSMIDHCASITEMDETIGWLLEALQQTGRDKNTLLLFLSDNGGEPLDQDRARVSNTPFAGWKVSQWEGGIATPLIGWWPGRIPAGAINTGHEVHLEDFMATFLEIAGVDYPAEFQGRKIFPAQGRSFLPALRDPNHAGPGRVWCWDHDSQRGVWAAPWKAVFTDRRHPIHEKNTPERFAGWALFKFDKHRIEMENLAGAHPEVLERMTGLWQEWADSVGWKPSARFALLPDDKARPAAQPPDPAAYDPSKSPIGRDPGAALGAK